MLSHVELRKGEERLGLGWAERNPPRSALTDAPAPEAPTCSRTEPAGRSTFRRLARGTRLSPGGSRGRGSGEGQQAGLPAPPGSQAASPSLAHPLPPAAAAPCVTVRAARQAHVDQVHGALIHGAALDGEVVRAACVVQHQAAPRQRRDHDPQADANTVRREAPRLLLLHLRAPRGSSEWAGAGRQAVGRASRGGRPWGTA